MKDGSENLRSLIRLILKESAETSIPQEELAGIASHYGVNFTEHITLSTFVDVYRAEPIDVGSYPTRDLVVKLSGKSKEYTAYARIKEIRELMLQSGDPGDVKAAEYMPIVYVAEPLTPALQKSTKLYKFKCIIIMEPLVHFSGRGVQEMPTMMSDNPVRNPKLLVAMLKDEEFLHRLIATSNLSPQETLRIENMIFTGATPTVQFGPSPWNKNEIIDWIGQKVRKNFNSYYMYKQYPDTEEGAKEFNVAMNLIQKEFMRIGYIYVDVLGEDRGVQAFENLIGEVQASQPIASLELDDPNPLPQNKQTRPEEIVPGAAGFNDALVRLEKFGMSRRDLSLSNYMMRKDGHIVIADPGAFKMKRV